MAATLRPLLFVFAMVLAAGCEPAPPLPVTPPPSAQPPPLPAATSAAAAPALPAPPVARAVPKVDQLHGEQRVDDYAWLRNKGSPEVMAYLEAENAYTAAKLAPTLPFQEALYQEMVARIQETDVTVPYKEGDYFYYARFEQGKQYPIHCRKKKSLEAPEAVVLDLNEIGKTEKFVAVGPSAVSDDGGLFAYGVDTTGFRQYVLHVKDLRTGAVLAESIPRVTSVAFAKGRSTMGASPPNPRGQLFYVVEDPTTKRRYRLYRHAIGKGKGGEDADALLYEEKDERFDLDVYRSQDREILFAASQSHTASEVRWLRADAPEGKLAVVAPREADHEYGVEHRGGSFYIRTNSGGRNFRLVTAPVSDRPVAREKWREIVPHRPEVMLEGFDVFKGFTVLHEREGGLQRLRILDDRDGEITAAVPFPERVASIRASDNAEWDTPFYRARYESPVTPTSIYDYDVKKKTLTLQKRDEVHGYDPARYEVERAEATAPDGVKIPLTLIRARGSKRDGPSPTLLYAYGSYGFPVPLTFSPARVSLLDRGVVYAMAHIRGGGEMGKKWHDHGRMMEKKNTFTDFIAAAEELIHRGVTTPGQLAIMGASAGGLLMGAVVNLRPDLFKAVVASVPFVDVINTMLDESLPLTVSEFEEWGNPKIKDQYDYMMSYSPYDNLARKAYPAMLVKTSYNDSQVMYWEPAKYVARLRALKTDQNPLYLRINMEPAGHGGPSGRYSKLRDTAFEYAFVLTELGIAR